GKYQGVGPESGVALTDFVAVAGAMGFTSVTIDDEATMAEQLADLYGQRGPIFCNVEIHPHQKLYPVVKYGSPLEEQLPPLDADVLDAEMITARFRPGSQVDVRKGGAGV